VLVFGSENSALNRSEGKENETSEICFLRRVSGYRLMNYVCKTIRNALQTYALEERIEGYKNKCLNHIISYQCNLRDRPNMLRIANRKDKDMLDGREMLGR
jgi:hypothetical protein